MTPESNSVEVSSKVFIGQRAKKTLLVYIYIMTVFISISSQVAHLHNECVTDTQICGAKFCDGDGYAFAVTGYDLSEIIRYTQT